jgi:tetratricopeptide (TPR) repeat protein
MKLRADLHIAVNNISTCLAQQTPPPTSLTGASSRESFPNTPAPSHEQLVEQATQWANKALARAATIAPPDRSEECDVGCAVATHNLGEFLEMEGKLDDARKKYDEAASLAKAVGFEEGQENAKTALKRIEGMWRK